MQMTCRWRGRGSLEGFAGEGLAAGTEGTEGGRSLQAGGGPGAVVLRLCRWLRRRIRRPPSSPEERRRRLAFGELSPVPAEGEAWRPGAFRAVSPSQAAADNENFPSTC